MRVHAWAAVCYNTSGWALPLLIIGIDVGSAWVAVWVKTTTKWACVWKRKKKPFLLEKLSFTLLDYTELSVTWAEDVQTVSVDLDNSDGKDIFKKNYI